MPFFIGYAIIGMSGFVLTFVGAIMIAIAIGDIGADGGSSPDQQGKEHYIAYMKKPGFWRWGIGLVIAGFFMQMVTFMGIRTSLWARIRNIGVSCYTRGYAKPFVSHA